MKKFIFIVFRISQDEGNVWIIRIVFLLLNPK